MQQRAGGGSPPTEAGIRPFIENRRLWKEQLERLLPGHDGTSACLAVFSCLPDCTLDGLGESGIIPTMQEKQQTGRSDQGACVAVTGGAQIDGFIRLFTDLICDAGVAREHLYCAATRRWSCLVSFAQPKNGISSSSKRESSQEKTSVRPRFLQTFSRSENNPADGPSGIWRTQNTIPPEGRIEREETQRGRQNRAEAGVGSRQIHRRRGVYDRDERTVSGRGNRGRRASQTAGQGV